MFWVDHTRPHYSMTSIGLQIHAHLLKFSKCHPSIRIIPLNCISPRHGSLPFPLVLVAYTASPNCFFGDRVRKYLSDLNGARFGRRIWRPPQQRSKGKQHITPHEKFLCTRHKHTLIQSSSILRAHTAKKISTCQISQRDTPSCLSRIVLDSCHP